MPTGKLVPVVARVKRMAIGEGRENQWALHKAALLAITPAFGQALWLQ
ncbi:MAG: hypothetical protein WAU05_01075 [Nitrospira sp.]